MQDPTKSLRLSGSAEADLSKLHEELKAHREEFGRLVSLPAYQYLKGIAAVFLAEYKCKPGKTAEGRIQFETYSNMKWLIDQVFSNAEAAATTPIQPVRQVKPPVKKRGK